MVSTMLSYRRPRPRVRRESFEFMLLNGFDQYTGMIVKVDREDLGRILGSVAKTIEEQTFDWKQAQSSNKFEDL